MIEIVAGFFGFVFLGASSFFIATAFIEGKDDEVTLAALLFVGVLVLVGSYPLLSLSGVLDYGSFYLSMVFL